jgi:hypothetical protein
MVTASATPLPPVLRVVGCLGPGASELTCRGGVLWASTPKEPPRLVADLGPLLRAAAAGQPWSGHLRGAVAAADAANTLVVGVRAEGWDEINVCLDCAEEPAFWAEVALAPAAA